MWFLIVLLVLAYMAISFKFPALVIWFLAAVAVLIIAVQYQAYRVEEDKSRIEASLAVTKNCPALEMTVFNHSSYDIASVEMTPIARQEGFSRNLIKGYATYKSDRIVPAGDEGAVCVEFPKLIEKAAVKELVWEYETLEIRFKDSRTYFLKGEQRY